MKQKIFFPHNPLLKLTMTEPHSGKSQDFIPLIVRLTKDYWQINPENSSAGFEDAVSEAIVAVLTTSAKRHDYRKAKLITFAYRRIIGAVQDLQRVEFRYCKRHSIRPHDEISKISTTTDAEFEQRESNKLLFLKVVAIMQRELTAHECLVIVRGFFQDRTDIEIAEELNIRRYRVPQIRLAALQAIRQRFPRGTSAFVS